MRRYPPPGQAQRLRLQGGHAVGSARHDKELRVVPEGGVEVGEVIVNEPAARFHLRGAQRVRVGRVRLQLGGPLLYFVALRFWLTDCIPSSLLRILSFLLVVSSLSGCVRRSAAWCITYIEADATSQ